jgi:cell wall-associated NlpC family hydrolase
MADPLTIPELTSRPPVSYDDIRSSLRTGDIVFCSGTYFFSKAIRLVTKSVWSHVGMIYRDDFLDRIFILESETMIGVRIAPLSKYLKDYHGRRKPYRGRMFVARLEPEVPPEAMKKAVSFGMDQLTKPYDNWEILRVAIRILLGVGRKSRDRKYICSELVYEAFHKAGIEFQYSNRSISPDDLWKDPRVKVRFRIH